MGTLVSYWETNLDFTKSLPELNLYSENWKLHTRSKEKPPVRFGKQGSTSCILVANGAIVNGRVEHSIICAGFYIEKGTVIRNSIVLNSSIICSNSRIENSIIDKEVEIKTDCIIGQGEDPPNKDKSDLMEILKKSPGRTKHCR